MLEKVKKFTEEHKTAIAVGGAVMVGFVMGARASRLPKGSIVAEIGKESALFDVPLDQLKQLQEGGRIVFTNALKDGFDYWMVAVAEPTFYQA